ncbi:ubiquitin-like-specific protease 1D [Ziziphus jujuba]|uniref:Ubiquitin-like-specific protease 1D n=1 Tax=Ziziphus jujuba TaxID=326968 RepID=A0ABM3I7T3_ZIZJJ|nr:ubiquitin-like-specific protease 1D [Ziziphus jujuba]
MCMEEAKPRKRRPLDLDWETLLPSQEDDPPAVLIVKSNNNQNINTLKDSSMAAADSRNSDSEYSELRDHELDDRIVRQKKNIEGMGPRLPDKGEKLRLSLKRMEEERERRKLRRVETVYLEEADRYEKPVQPICSCIPGGCDGSKKEHITCQSQSQSLFASRFSQKIEEKTDSGKTNSFDKELSLLGSCDHRQMKNNGDVSQKGRQEISQKGRQKFRSIAKDMPSKHPGNMSRNGANGVHSYNDQKGRAFSTYSSHVRENSSNFFAKKNDASHIGSSIVLRPRKTIVLIDEEEPQITEAAEQMEKLPECMKDAKIYYPSRDDPEAEIISYADMDCLAPEGYLTSTIMNFYIRYLQQHASPTNRATCDCHFFNTYFYKKLKEAVSYKGNNKDKLFVKFRRWWKGVNIFQKAYVLIPIHEDVHWSLVIICFPDKEEESGPIILHLDSLRLHSSRSVFQNIKSFLKEEWHYLGQEFALPDLPIADSIWRQLPQRITEKIISVPQQKNEYDCGLFVLFFMERFIVEAPERLKKKDLAMFGKQWFKPEEASGLRAKIRNVLIKEFKKASEVECISETLSPSSSDAQEEWI